MGVHPSDVAGKKHDENRCLGQILVWSNLYLTSVYFFPATSDDDVASILEQISKFHPSQQHSGVCINV